MRGEKKGQFFLLAAVIISVIVISLGATTNRVLVQNNFQDIDGLSYEVERELGEVLNYEIYTVTGGGEVENFASLIAEDIQDTDSDTEFIFIFGSSDGMTVSNYGEDDITIIPTGADELVYCVYEYDYIHDTENTLEDCAKDKYCYACEYDYEAESTFGCVSPFDPSICFKTFLADGKDGDEECFIGAQEVECDTVDFDPDAGDLELEADELLDDEITVNVDGVDVVIPVSDYPQAYLIIKKDSDDEVYFANK